MFGLGGEGGIYVVLFSRGSAPYLSWGYTAVFFLISHKPVAIAGRICGIASVAYNTVDFWKLDLLT